MLISTATAKDYEEIRPFFLELQLLHQKQYPHIYTKQNPLSLEYYNFLLENGFILKSMENKKIIGILAASISHTPPYPAIVQAKIASIEAIAVLKDYRRQGIAKKLMEEARTKLKERQCDRITLTVWNFNEEAKAFYEHCGFHDISCTMEYKMK